MTKTFRNKLTGRIATFIERPSTAPYPQPGEVEYIEPLDGATIIYTETVIRMNWEPVQ